jgi:hypothetical protein
MRHADDSAATVELPVANSLWETAWARLAGPRSSTRKRTFC